MGLIEIEYGALASSTTMNTNFSYLDNRINASNESIVSIQNSLSSMNTTLSQSIENSKLELLQTIYPIGSIYIGATTECPLASLFGTWEKVSEGRVLQGSDEIHEAGTTIEAGLPNITGRIGSVDTYSSSSTGCFYRSGASGRLENSNGGADPDVYLDASRSSSIYGSSDTVQPPAFVVNIWRRVA